MLVQRLELSVDSAVADDRSAWDEFCRQHGWFWHSTHWREYTLRYRPEAHSQSLAFGVRLRDRLVAVVPLMVERSTEYSSEHSEVSFGGAPCWAPAIDTGLADWERARVMAYAVETIDDAARAHHAVRAALQLSPLIPNFTELASVFIAASGGCGYLDRSTSTTMVDVTRSDEELLAQMTHGHRQSIARARRSIEVRVSSAGGDFDCYRQLHHAAAGRQTRPAATFELMRSWLAREFALLAIAEIDGRPAGAILAIVFGDGAYYASAANDPALRGQPIGHALQWGLMRALRERGITRYETGAQPAAPSLHHLPSEKERAIGKFKASFGGAEVPLFARERFFSPGFAERVLRARLDRYLEAVSTPARADATA
jgi:hypothetical protein